MANKGHPLAGCRRPRDSLKKGKGEEALQRLRQIMGKLNLTVNEEKTCICRRRKASSTSWATRLGGCIRLRPARPVIGCRPSKKTIQRAGVIIGALTDQLGTWQDTKTLVAR
jgi:RNA-directed DNA polymerase